MSTDDKYAVKVLFHNNFCTQSAEVLEKVGFTYVEKHNMKGVQLESYFLNRSNRNKTVKKQENYVIDYVWSQVKDQYGFKKYTYEKLKEGYFHIHMYQFMHMT